MVKLSFGNTNSCRFLWFKDYFDIVIQEML